MFKLLKPKEVATAVNAVATAVAATVATVLPEGMTLEQVHAAMMRLLGQESLNHYLLGVHYNYLVNKKLAEKAGFKDARDYVSKHLKDLSQASLTMYGAVAAAFPEAVAVRFGVTCLSLLLTYKEAADLEVNHLEPGPTLIEVPGENGQVETKTFGACSVEEMRKALLLKRKPSSSKPVPAEAVALADQYQEAVNGLFPHGVLVKVAVRNHKGKAVLDFKGVPVEQVARLIEALTGPQPLVPAQKQVEQVTPTA